IGGSRVVVGRRYACGALLRARRCCTLVCFERILCRSQCRIWLGHIRLDEQFTRGANSPTGEMFGGTLGSNSQYEPRGLSRFPSSKQSSSSLNYLSCQGKLIFPENDPTPKDHQPEPLFVVS